MFYVRMIWLFCLLFVRQKIVSQGLTNKVIIIQKSGSIATREHFTNHGKFQQQAGSLVFAGNGNIQKLAGDSPIAFNRLFVSSGANALLVSSGHTVRNVVKSDGLLQANNRITFLSDANTTAAVDGAGVGEITGNLTFQSYLLNGFGYKYLGSPFQTATLNELSSFVNLNADFPSVYKYDENLLSNGWVNYMSASNVMEPMKGYTIQFGSDASAKTISMNGVVNNGNITLNLFNNNKIYTNGFQLISNPYPSPINWNEPLGWSKVNIDNALYFFDTDGQSIYTGVYSTYINGISSNGLANNFIPATQAFFIRVSDGDYPVAGSITINNKARITHITQAHRKLNSVNDYQMLRLSLGMVGQKMTDPLIVYFSSESSQLFNKRLDAVKLMNASDGVPSLFSIKDNHSLAIHSHLPVDVHSIIPLGVKIKKSGEYSFSLNEVSLIPQDLYVYIKDSLAGKFTDIKKNLLYRVQLNEGEHIDRFSIVLSKIPLINQVNQDNNILLNAAKVEVRNRRVYISLPFYANNTYTIQLSNILGQRVYTNRFSGGQRYLINTFLTNGIYILTLWDGKNYFSKKILISE